MKNLMTRKFVLGLLLTCVLAFSVQGTADAVSFASNAVSLGNNVTDLSTHNINGTITITLTSANLWNNSTAESFTISVSGANATLKHGSVAETTSFTFHETPTTGQTGLPGSVTCTVRAPGVVNVYFRDNTSATGYTRAADKVFTFYVVRQPLQVSPTDTITLQGVTNGVGYPYDENGDIQIYRGDGSNNRVTYKLETGYAFGTLYIRQGNRAGQFQGTTLETSSAAQVWLSMGGGRNATNLTGPATTPGTNFVIAEVTGNGNQTKGVYIYKRPSLVVTVATTKGFDTAPSSTVEGGEVVPNAFTIKIVDGKASVQRDRDGNIISSTGGTNVPYVPVRFEVRDKTVTGGTLVPQSAYTIVDTSNRPITNPSAGSILSVQTKTETTPANNDAKIDYQAGVAGQQQVITVSAVGMTREVKVYTAAPPDRRLTIHTNRKRGSVYDLVALLQDDGENKAGVIVAFSTIKGGLSSTPAHSSHPTVRIEETTDSLGRAHVVYDPGDSTGNLEVLAGVARKGTAAPTSDPIEITFSVGSGSTGTQPTTQPTQPQGTGRALLTLSPDPISGNPGNQVDMRARAVNAQGQPVSGVTVTFTLSTTSGSVSPTTDTTDNNGYADTRLTLPDANAVLTATANNYDRDQVNITVRPVPSDLVIVSGDNQTGAPGEALSSALVVRFEDAEDGPVVGAQVTFTVETGGGSLSAETATTNANGEVETTLTLGNESARNTVRASVSSTTYPNVDSITFTAEAELGPDRMVIAGGNEQQGQVDRRLEEDFSVQVVDSANNGVSGELVRFRITEGSGRLSRNSTRTNDDGYADINFTPRGTQNITVEAYSTGLDSVYFTVTLGEPPDAITKVSGDNQSGTAGSRLNSPFVVQVIDTNDEPVQGVTVTFAVTAGGGSISPRSATTDSNGRAQTTLTLGQARGAQTVTARVSGLTAVTFRASTGPPPDAITKVSGDNQSGRPGSTLTSPLVVKVIDANDNPVQGVTVTFAVTAGGGSVSPASATTNNNGQAQTRLTLGQARGDHTVAARVSGLSAITFKASLGAQVLVNASQRAPMYWISQGKLQRLVGASIENIAPNVTGVMDVAIDAANNRLYFAVKTGTNTGAIRRSSLTGQNVQTLQTLTAVPRSIAVDSAGRVVYWATSRGMIQSKATSGNAAGTTLLRNLSNPSGLTYSNGYLYWAEPTQQRVRRANLTPRQKVAQNIATGIDEPLSVSVSRDKVYWIERVTGGKGSLNRSNLNGSAREELRTFASWVPNSVAVHSASNRVYWARGSGEIQDDNLTGSGLRSIVSGLTQPRGIAVGGSAEPTQTATQPAQTPTTYSRYDINRDGKVNNMDTRLVAAAIGQRGNAITNPRTDVDGNSVVDVTDIILVIGNLDDDVAAPAIDIDVKALDMDVAQVQKQIEALLASGDRSHAAQRALLYLQHLLAAAHPSETALLANYPNPFNPETWIPYHLAASTDVTVRIYDSHGTLVRVLALGHQTAGYYTSRSRAAYWDGRNALGERVASGIYFYQLEADELSPMRKMVILK